MLALLGFPGGTAGKESASSEGDLGSVPELGRSPEEGKGYPLQYSGLENSIDCIVHGVAKSWTRLSDFNFHFLLFGMPCRAHNMSVPSKLSVDNTPSKKLFSDSAKDICLLQLMGLQSTLFFPPVTSLIPSHWCVCVCIYL